MEFLKHEISEEEIEKYKQYTITFFKMRKLLGLGDDKLEWIRDTIPKVDTDTLCEYYYQTTLEAEIPEADLEDVYLHYIPDYIREYSKKKDYWKEEFLYWNDIISQKNWKLYDRKVKDELRRHKIILRNLDKMLQEKSPNPEYRNHFSMSLEPERLENWITFIKENESQDQPYEDMMKTVRVNSKGDPLQICYIHYAIYARYGKFVVRPSRLSSSQDVKAE